MARKKAADAVEDLDLEEDFEDFDEEEEAEASPKKRRSKKAAKEDEGPRGLGAREMAEYLEVEPKTFRAWLRRKIESEDLSLGDRDARQRYDFGEDFDSPQAQAVIQLYTGEQEEKARRAEEAAEAAAAKEEAEAKSKPAPKKKAPAKKKAAAKKS